MFLKKIKSISVKSLNRKLFLDELPEAICNRKESRTNRIRCFWVAIDILKHEKKYKIHSKNNKEFEIKGISRDGKITYIHLREKVDLHKDKKLFFISCYHDHKT